MKYEEQHEQRQDNDLVMPLQPQSKFLSMIVKNKPVTQAYKPTIICLVVGFIFFFSLSIAMFVSMVQTQSVTVPYYQPQSNNCLVQGTNCSISFTLDERMDAPVYFMYQMDNFYQNQRLFIQSKDSSQLAGKQVSMSQAHTCRPFITNQQMGVTMSYGGTPLDPQALASPCGSFAKAFFNDTFTLSSQGKAIPIQETGITWPGEIGGQFAQGPKSKQTQWVNPQDEHFIVWMRSSGLPDFKKLWGVIQTPLEIGTYQLTIENNYSTEQWQGSKYIVLTTIGTFGAQNYTLPVMMLLMSLMCIVAVLFIVRLVYNQKKFSVQ